jgi:carboxypeptidase family protein/TonB-dependent receptor-like protein
MRLMKVALWLLVALLATAGIASAQSTTGTISGRVLDTQDRTVPGVTVSVESPSLQGVRTAVTSENGDYIVTLLPPGTYTVTFELSGFQRQQRQVTLAPTQTLPVDVTMGLAGVTETVEVVGRSADVLTRTAQVATNFSQDLIATLPTNRDINSTLLLAPSVHPTGPAGGYSIAGSMSFENLFLINGVTVNENIRGQAFNLYIEDAIQETTISTAGISAEYGRFGGGVVNMITKSGGNQFTASFRDTLNNDNWRALVPKRTGDTFANDSKIAKVVPTYEYTIGGPVFRDHLWFFIAGRMQERESSLQLVQTNLPYAFTQDSKRYEGNATYSPTSNHRIQGTIIKETLDQFNNTFNRSLSMDLRSLEDRSTPQDLFTVNYSGILTPRFFIEGRFSQRNFTFVGSGAKSTDIIEGTLLIDRQRNNQRYWAATFCGVCTNEERDNQNFFVKASYFTSTSNYGSHNVVLGYDHFNDVRVANNRQSGSDYRILGTTTIINANNEIFPVFLGDGSTRIQWNPIPVLTQGSAFRTHGLFANDSWRVSNKLTANIGIRYDKNHGTNQAGELVAKDDAISPRLGIVYDPTGAGDWSITASFARYVAAVANSIADSSSAAGNPQTWVWQYRGADINGGNPANPLSTPAALAMLWTWFETTSGCKPMANQTCQPNLPNFSAPTIPGVAQRIGENLTTPNNLEYAFGINRTFGAKAAVRADYVFRDYKDVYVSHTDLSTGRVTNNLGQTFDLTFIENTDLYKRRYSGVSAQGTYRFTSRFDVGATYTLSRLWGNINGETANSGPVTGDALQYPEYKRPEWNYPEGDLASDQRHRGRLWVNYGVPMLNGLTLSLMETLESGVPYNANNPVNPSPYVANPGYVTPPTDAGATAITYFFTARDAFHAEGQKRTDFAANYNFGISTGNRRLGLFVQAQVINLFNQFQLCGCGAEVFLNGGASQVQFINQAVLSNTNASGTYPAFNPFTTTPVEGVHWAKGPAFGHASSRFAYTTPRMFRIGFGVRF